MKFGVTMFPTDYAIQPVELSQAVEERGLDSLFFPEHTHIPASRRSPFPGGGDLPKMYWHTHDPFVALGAAAAVTSRIALGTGICLVIERDPITLAKEAASLDMISEGRFILGVGAGWNQEEMENHGVHFPQRWAQVREKVLAMKAIWTESEPEFHGEHVDFDPIWSYPKPVQAGGPPIWIGAKSPWVYDRIAEYADGWMPMGHVSSDNMDRLTRALDERGRDVRDLDLALCGAPMDPSQLAERIDQGFGHLIFNIPSESREQILPRLDKLASLAEEIRVG